MIGNIEDIECRQFDDTTKAIILSKIMIMLVIMMLLTITIIGINKNMQADLYRFFAITEANISSMMVLRCLEY